MRQVDEVIEFLRSDTRGALKHYGRNPADFVRDVLRAKPTDDQAEVMQAVADARAGRLDKTRFAVKSGTGVGKTAMCSWLILWHLAVFKDSKIPCTAPTSPQIKAVLWPELRKWVHDMPEALKEVFPYEVTVDTCRLYSDNFAVARTAQKEKPEAFQGFHCLSDEHTILTKRGWLGVDEITTDDYVLSPPVNGEIATWEKVDDVHSYNYDGKINHYDSKFVDMMFTDGHRFINRQSHESDWNIRAYDEIHQKNFFMRRSSYWGGQDFSVPECFVDAGFSKEDFLTFLGLWLSEGGIRPHSNGKASYEVLLYQKKESGKKFIEDKLGHLGFTYYQDFYRISNKSICDWLIENCGVDMTQKKLPDFVKDSKPDHLNLLIDALWMGDGSFYPDGRKRSYYSTSRQLMDDIQEALIKIGRTCSIGVNRYKGHVANSGIKTQNTCYVLSYIWRSCDHLLKKPKVKKINYSGRVWCISTKNETFYTKKNEKVFLSGNSRNIMLIADEASGIPDEIFDAGQGVMSEEGAILFMVGNPTRPFGFFYDAFHNDRGMYWTKTISCVDNEQVTDGYVRDTKEKYGEDSFQYQVRVLGKFYLEDDDIIIPRSWLEAAVKRDGEIEIDGSYVSWGFDPSDGGRDAGALAKRQGNTLLEPVITYPGLTSDRQVDRVVEEFFASNNKPNEIVVDAIGVGANVMRTLKRKIGDKVRIKPVYVGTKPTDERYTSYRVELWGRGRQWVKSSFSVMPKDEDLIRQLSSVVWEISERTGKYRIPDKKVGGKSPNRADAFLLTFHSRAARDTSVLTSDRQYKTMKQYTKGQGSASWLN